ncbi:hypothetical protein DdX_01522 [Ditylenchus destructor]|uniref:Uncharacterized protein n=1 Tax=Ditylenchus destructor TaxID=166010 RepID=A0AAD4RDY8_9BILA|nr:hypothetical protein DdX_01522 [Ditylenchus destructor]
MEGQNQDTVNTSGDSSITNTRPFVSAQRRYDNVRVRDAEMKKRLCYECGEVIDGGEKQYQEHILSHEATYLAYQLYHSEKDRRNTTSKNIAQDEEAKKS